MSKRYAIIGLSAVLALSGCGNRDGSSAKILEGEPNSLATERSTHENFSVKKDGKSKVPYLDEPDKNFNNLLGKIDKYNGDLKKLSASAQNCDSKAIRNLGNVGMGIQSKSMFVLKPIYDEIQKSQKNNAKNIDLDGMHPSQPQIVSFLYRYEILQRRISDAKSLIQDCGRRN